MKTKAKVFWLTGLAAVAGLSYGQTNSNALTPTVPRGDGTGTAIPSHNPVGDARGSESAKAAAGNTPTTGNAAPGAVRNDRPGPSSRVPAGDELGANRIPAQIESGAAVADTTAMARRIRELGYSDRAELLAAIENRMTENQREIDEVRQVSPRLDRAGRQAYRAAMRELRSRRDTLGQALALARKATPQNWERIREVLATQYEEYNVAVTRVETVPPGSM